MNATLPDKNGHFGIFGGRYAAETLMPALIELDKAYESAKKIKLSKRNSNGISVNMRGAPRLFITREECRRLWVEQKFISNARI